MGFPVPQVLVEVQVVERTMEDIVEEVRFIPQECLQRTVDEMVDVTVSQIQNVPNNAPWSSVSTVTCRTSLWMW